jgi:hypothetical protein
MGNIMTNATQADQGLTGDAGCVGAVAADPVFLDNSHPFA